MARMIRKQVYIRVEHEVILKRRAKELGVTESELIRRGVELATNQKSPGPRDPRAWAEAMALMKERAKIRVPQTGRSWTRDELYDD